MVRPPITHELNFREKRDIWTIIEQKSIRNMKLYHLKDKSETAVFWNFSWGKKVLFVKNWVNIPVLFTEL